ncbi:MAG: hypothetical protein JWM47_3525 [Acidimicrobiales bacterium]|nr:hypothetical protein [Acidimicrobiales bacterium]
MPIDIPEAVPTTRRTFLTRAALAGALVTVGSAAGPLTSLLPVAGAQEGLPEPGTALDDGAFAAALLPLELAAVQCYELAIQGGTLGDEWTTNAGLFQTHHQDVVDLLTTFVPETTPPTPDAKADATVLDVTGGAVKAANDERAALSPLAELEEVLAATHLYALGSLEDATAAKTVAQVLAVESQHAVALGLAADTTLTELTPDVATTDASRTGSTTTTSSSTTTTTEEAGN